MNHQPVPRLKLIRLAEKDQGDHQDGGERQPVQYRDENEFARRFFGPQASIRSWIATDK